MTSNELIKTFAANLRTRRKELGLTQQDLADQFGVSAPHISQLESAKDTPSLQFLASLAAVLRVPPDAFLRPEILSPAA